MGVPRVCATLGEEETPSRVPGRGVD